METVLEVDDFFLLLQAMLTERRAALRGKGRIAFGVVGSGAYVLDLERPSAIEHRFDDTADTIVLCNQEGLAQLANGTLGSEPDDGALLLWSGERGPLSSLATALGGNRSVFDARLAALKGVR